MGLASVSLRPLSWAHGVASLALCFSPHLSLLLVGLESSRVTGSCTKGFVSPVCHCGAQSFRFEFPTEFCS